MSTRNPSVIQFILKLVFFIPVGVYQILKSSGKWLQKRIGRDGWVRHLVVDLVGVPISGVVGWQLADVAAFTWGLGSLSWFTIFIVTSVLIWSHLWCSIYYFALRHIWDFIERVLKYWDRFCREILSPVTRDITNWTRKAPGADALWSNVETPEGYRSTGVRFLEAFLAVTGVGFIAFASYLAYGATMTAGSVYVASHTVMVVTALAAAATTFGTLFAIAASLLDSKAPNVVVSWSTIVAASVAWFVHSFTGLSGGANAAISGATWLFGTAYLLPGAITVMQTGRIKKLVMRWYGLIDDCYHEEENKDFQKFNHHLQNLIMAPVIGWCVYGISLQASSPLWLAVVLGAVAFVYGYTEFYKKDLNTSRGNAELGATFVLLATYFAYDSIAPASTFASVALVIGLLVANFLVVYPLVYIVTRAITTPIAAAAGVKLEAMHTFLSSGINKMFEGLRELQTKAWDDRTDFAPLFGQVLNLVVVGAAVLQGGPALSGHMTSYTWLNVILTAFIGVNAFVLFGRLFTRYGAETLSTVLGLSSAASVGYYAYVASGSYTVAVAMGIIVCGIAAGVIAPLFYLGLRKIAEPVTPTLAPLAKDGFEALWNIYKEIWAFIGRISAQVLSIFAPIFALVAGTIAAVSASISRMFSRG